jgi:hypothetical protein
VAERFRPALEEAVAAKLGARSGGRLHRQAGEAGVRRADQLPIRDRFARHRADFEALGRHSSRADALARLDLLADVVRHKSRFFASAWTHYETARPGTFRRVPPRSRHAALARDYATMAPMFISAPIASRWGYAFGYHSNCKNAVNGINTEVPQ